MWVFVIFCVWLRGEVMIMYCVMVNVSMIRNEVFIDIVCFMVRRGMYIFIVLRCLRYIFMKYVVYICFCVKVVKILIRVRLIKK